MPMGIVNDKEFERERANSSHSRTPNSNPTRSPKTPKEPEVKVPDLVPPETRGRSEGDNNVPNSLRNLIGSESIESGRQSALELAKEFGISPSSVSAYNKGATSTASYSDRPNTPIINTARLRVQKKAQNRMNLALNALTEDKINQAKARDIAAIAKDMSVIVKTMEPDSEKDTAKQQPQFVVFAPTIRDERSYETIFVKE